MRESRFRTNVLAVLNGELAGQAIPVETADAAGEGVPDVELCLPGGPQAWLELKVAPYRVKTATFDLSHMRRLQARWLRDRWRLGGPCGLLIRCEGALGDCLEHILLDGEDAARFFLDQGTHWHQSSMRAASYLPEGGLDAESLRAAIQSLVLSARVGQDARDASADAG